MASPAAHSPESPHGADGHELDDGLDSLRRLVVGQGWPWVLVWLVSRGWMVSQWAQHYRYIANDVNYYFGQLRQPGGQANTLREYPLPVVWLLDLLRKPVAGDPNLYLVLFACSMALLDAAFSIWLWRRHSRVASIYWMAYVFAMGPLVWFRYDLLAGVIVGMAAFLVAKDSRASGALVALGAAMKLWPALLVVALVGRTRDARRSLQAFLVTGASLALLSLLAAGPTRLFSPLTWQSDRGLQIESVWASLPMWHYHHDEWVDPTQVYSVHMSPFNAYEVYGPNVDLLVALASMTMAVSVLFALAVALLSWHRGSVQPEVRAMAMTAIVLAMLVGNKTLSPQYMVWLGAVMAAWLGLSPRGLDRVRSAVVAAIALVLAALTAYIYPGHYGEITGSAPGSDKAVLALVVRNLGLVVMCLVLTIWTIRSLMPPRRFARAAGETDNISTR